METVSESFDPGAKLLRAHSPQGGEQQLRYDRLIIATGAEPVKPPIPGLGLPAVHVLHTMEDSFAVREAVESGAHSVLIVGGGYIGLEMADAFRHRGIEVTLAEMANQVRERFADNRWELVSAEPVTTDEIRAVGRRVDETFEVWRYRLQRR
jgi:NADPH-dependent 2,4-dienoyl-CoA reductase/sulfur reductase-like enzyme